MNRDEGRGETPVEVRNLVATYGEVTVLDGVDLSARAGLITVILGKSGCGKTTLLRHALGLSEPASGTVRLLGTDIATLTEEELASLRSRIGVLFQNGALFTSMTVGENIAFAIRERADLPDALVSQMVHMKLSLVELEHAVDKIPEQLSAGMKKRAALARALANDPELLFCDEPSAGLDPVRAAELDEMLLRVRDLLGMTVVVVTHELESIKRIADSVVMLDGGRIIAQGTLDQVMQSPDRKVHDFFHRVARAETRPSFYGTLQRLGLR